MLCDLCPRKCNKDRNNEYGYCSSLSGIRISKVMRHMWEEPIISGANGSGAIFTSGCNLRCRYCQNYEISHSYIGRDYTPKMLAELMKRLEESGVHNIDFITASHYADGIIRALDIYKPSIPVVFNTGGYESVDTLRRLEGYIDVYLPDFKYSDSALARYMSSAPDYFDVAKEAIREMYRQQPCDVIEDEIMKKGVIIRHLIIPNEIKNTLGVTEYLDKNIPHDKYISLMSQYTPSGECLEGRYARRIKPIEYKIALKSIENFDNAFIQDASSAKEEFIPDFNNGMEYEF